MQSQVLLLQADEYQQIIRLHQADRVARQFVGFCIWLLAVCALATVWFGWRAFQSGQWAQQQCQDFQAELNYVTPIALLMPAVELTNNLEFWANDTIGLQRALTLHAERLCEYQARRHQHIITTAPRTDLGNWNVGAKGKTLISKIALRKAYDRATAPLREAAT